MGAFLPTVLHNLEQLLSDFLKQKTFDFSNCSNKCLSNLFGKIKQQTNQKKTTIKLYSSLLIFFIYSLLFNTPSSIYYAFLFLYLFFITVLGHE